jgi:hypothetical protein
MTFVIRNTFLEIEEVQDFSDYAARMCHSVPLSWRPAVSAKRFSPDASMGAAAEASPRSTCTHDTSIESLTELSVPETSGDETSVGDRFVDTGVMCLQCSPIAQCGPRAKQAIIASVPDVQSNGDEPCRDPTGNAIQEQELHNEVTIDAIIVAIQTELQSRAPSATLEIKHDVANESRRVVISVDLHTCAQPTARPYNMIQAVRQVLQSGKVAGRVSTLLSARVQKEDSGYSLRSSVACFPDGKRDKMCWDFLQRGSCPRRHICRWHHPSAADIVKFKVVMRSSESQTGKGIMPLQPYHLDTRSS